MTKSTPLALRTTSLILLLIPPSKTNTASVMEKRRRRIFSKPCRVDVSLILAVGFCGLNKYLQHLEAFSLIDNELRQFRGEVRLAAYLLWLRNSEDSDNVYPVSLEPVFIEPLAGQSVKAHPVFPSARSFKATAVEQDG